MTTSILLILGQAQGSVLSHELPYSTPFALDFLTFASSLIFLLREVKNSSPIKNQFSICTYWLLWSECLHRLKTHHVGILTPKDGIRKWGLQELLEP